MPAQSPLTTLATTHVPLSVDSQIADLKSRRRSMMEFTHGSQAPRIPVCSKWAPYCPFLTGPPWLGRQAGCHSDFVSGSSVTFRHHTTVFASGCFSAAEQAPAAKIASLGPFNWIAGAPRFGQGRMTVPNRDLSSTCFDSVLFSVRLGVAKPCFKARTSLAIAQTGSPRSLDRQIRFYRKDRSPTVAARSEVRRD